MKQLALSLRSVFISAIVGSALIGCSPEHGVEFSSATTELEGIVLSNSAIELEVGQVIGVRATATKNDERKPNWEVSIESVDKPIFSALTTWAPRDEEGRNVYAIIAHKEGVDSFTMVTKEKHEVTVSITVTPRTESEED